MPEEKLKTENYTNFSGIDRKTSRYITQKNSCLTLENLDFRTVGAWSTAPGTTAFSTVSATTSITGISDYYATSVTYGYGGITYTSVATTQSHLCNITGTTFPTLYTFLFPSNPTPYAFERGTYLYATNQWDFLIYPGFTTAWQYSLPKPYFSAYGVRSVSFGGGITLGQLAVAFAFVRSDGLYGPAAYYDPTLFSLVGAGVTAFSLDLPGIPPFQVASPLGTGPSLGSFGVSGIQVWVGYSNSTLYASPTLYPLTGASLAIYASGSSFLGFTNSGVDPEEYFGTFLYGFATDNGASLGGTWNLPSNPSCIAMYNNQLFSGGFYYTPDDVWYSQVGELEKHDFEAFFSVRAGDGDIVSCLISYFTQLIIFKINSIHQLTGTDPDNFVLTEVNNQYGCLAPRAAAIWEQNLWFLDKKGICIYNGANTKIVSNAVEDYFLRMNVEAARTQAIMIHVKERNEVWTAIPIDGSSYNNIVIVYDYLADAWWTRTVTQATALANLTRGVGKQVLYQGDYSGMISTYGNSFFADRGTAFTCAVQSRFHSDLGHSTEKQWRRLWIDADIPSGSTYVFPIDFFTDQGTTPALQMTMVMSEFQNRLEFGLPAKDMSFKLYYSGGRFLRFNGYTIAYRFQRDV